MIEENGQKYGDADVGDAGSVPVDFRTRKGRIVLARRYDNAEDKGQNRAEREERCLVRQR